MKMKWQKPLEIITFLLMTLWGVARGEVTVFYIIYLFWFQEFIRTCINVGFAYSKGLETGKRPAVKDWSGNLFLLFVYLVFIVLLFGFMLNWDNLGLLGINIKTLMFRNWSFNLNIALFAIQYFMYRKNVGVQGSEIKVFNKQHIILHISIIVGALLQMLVVKKYPNYFSGKELWGSVLVIVPFLILKWWVGNSKELERNRS